MGCIEKENMLWLFYSGRREEVIMQWLWSKKWLGSLAAFAMMVATVSANSTCLAFFHQDELPETAKKLRRF